MRSSSDLHQPRPGRPGRGYDPSAAFTDLQWYFYHQRAVAYFGAFSTAAYDPAALVAFARALIAAAPQFLQGCRRCDGGPTDDTLQRIVSLHTVAGFAGFPDAWIHDGARVNDDPDLPMFRIRVAQLAGGADAQGRRSFVLVQVAHALTEGNDSARLSRSKAAGHESDPGPTAPVPLRSALPARLMGHVHALLHLAVSRLWTPHPGAVRPASRRYPRRLLQQIAREIGVSQRALFLALVVHAITDAGTPAGRRVSVTYTTLADGGGNHRDRFMRMRLRFTTLDNRPDGASYARAVDERLNRVETGYEAEEKATALRFHRRLARLMPFLYSPKFFSFWTYDVVFSLLTPHQIAGELTQGMMEPVYCGTMIPGVNACIVVPGREWVTFNFTLEARKLGQVERLDAAVRGLAARLPAPEALWVPAPEPTA